MATRQWREVAQEGPAEYSSYGLFETTQSPRDALGRLKLVPNPHRRVVGKTFYTKWGKTKWQLRGCQNDLEWYDPTLYNKTRDALTNSALAKFRGKLYYGSAALGVTIGSYKQSREMIQKRYNDLTTNMSEVMARSSRLTPKKAASLHLETIFGWQPLMQDIYAASTTVVQHASPVSFITSRASVPINDRKASKFSAYSLGFEQSFEGEMRVTLAAGVRVSNPNLWLLERLGLLNPAAVAWDLVPWSFVINMFVNTGQLVNSVTDYVGLEFDRQTFTICNRGVQTYKIGYLGDMGETQWMNNTKVRTVGDFPRPSLQLKLPDVNWELAAMAASLAIQQSTRFVRVITAAGSYFGRSKRI